MTRILLIEDNEVDIDLFEEYVSLTGTDFKIRSTGRLKHAINILENKENFDIVIVDLNLPDSNGLNTFKELSRCINEIPVIVLSGMENQEVALKSISLGAQDYILKNKLTPYILHKSISYSIERSNNQKLWRTTESKVREKQKMEAIGRFAGGIAHDFNNLMTVVLGYAKHLKNVDITRMSSDDFKFPVSEIINSGNRAVKLTKQLLLFSSNRVIKDEVSDVGKIITQMQPMFKKLIYDMADLIVDIRSVNNFIKLNQTKVEQIVMNLVINSVDAIVDAEVKGQIVIEIDQEVRDIDGEFLKMTVKDNGKGIDDTTIQHIFEPFYTTKSEDRGTGLGLSTIYGIIHSAGGHIEVDSIVDEGTAITIFLPLIDAISIGDQSEESAFSKVESTLDKSDVTILVVENDQSVLILYANTLNKLGYNLALVSNGLEAKHYLINNKMRKVDIIISDLFTPYLNGIEFHKWLRTDYSDEMPLILISGTLAKLDEERKQIESIQNHKKTVVLQKPTNFSAVDQIITRFL